MHAYNCFNNEAISVLNAPLLNVSPQQCPACCVPFFKNKYCYNMFNSCMHQLEAHTESVGELAKWSAEIFIKALHIQPEVLCECSCDLPQHVRKLNIDGV